MSEQPGRTKYCTECGAEINYESELCPECGVPQSSGGDSTGSDSGGLSWVGWLIVGAVVVFFVIPIVLTVLTFVLGAGIMTAFVLGGGDTVETQPQVSLDYSYDEAAGELTITVVESGVSSADQLGFEGTGFDQAGTTWRTQSGNDTIEPGDEVTLTGVEPDFQLQIRRVFEDGGGTALLDTHRGPDA